MINDVDAVVFRKFWDPIIGYFCRIHDIQSGDGLTIRIQIRHSKQPQTPPPAPLLNPDNCKSRTPRILRMHSIPELYLRRTETQSQARSQTPVRIMKPSAIEPEVRRLESIPATHLAPPVAVSIQPDPGRLSVPFIPPSAIPRVNTAIERMVTAGIISRKHGRKKQSPTTQAPGHERYQLWGAHRV